MDDVNKYFEVKLATVFRDKEENFVPTSSTLNKKNSNLFGSATNFINENLKWLRNRSISDHFL